ncbi:unnamed protein product [Rotaria sordida]|uniref:Uncharacterized protein n=1 Tax=Rotaria sordida TaxID=392033 RepID=A0A820P402_9BILA|nr:unnamed protein product [Rotaria sordida]
MSTIKKGLSVFDNYKQQISELSSNKPMEIYIRAIFLRIGEIDTLNERYQAQASIEARWPVEIKNIIF